MIQWSSSEVRVLATILSGGMFPFAPLVEDRWLAVDLDRWLRRGQHVDRANVKRLIDLHFDAFVHSEPLVCVRRPLGVDYLLSHSQAIMYCTKSRLPRAFDVMEVVIKTVCSGEVQRGPCRV
jgi:hypothetical protein